MDFNVYILTWSINQVNLIVEIKNCGKRIKVYNILIFGNISNIKIYLF